MKEDKRGGRKPAPVPTGHDQRAAARDHSVPHGNRKNDAIPPSKGARAGRHLRLLGISAPISNGIVCFFLRTAQSGSPSAIGGNFQ